MNDDASTPSAEDPGTPAPAEGAPAAEAAPVASATPVAEETSAAAPTASADAAPLAKRPAPRAGLPARATPPPPSERPTIELARRVVELAEDKKAADIVLLEVEPLTTIADYLVICSGGSERQLAAIADGVVEGLKGEHAALLGREGTADSHWILIDAGSVIVHVFAPPEREYYGLERLWAEARTVLRVQ
ncbi:MAG: ribosome silencing factor [Chloroflexi bacterium]|jgi:ribosome-associated protein|nr:ribosome silencing factor [Chloroflexota bacterium]